MRASWWRCCLALACVVAGPAAAAEPPAVVSEAVALEEAAFAAVEAEQWCLAMHLFVKADAAAPAPALLENAANAAEFAGDLERAVALLEALEQRETPAKRRARKAAVAQLKARHKGKASTTCPALEVLQPPPPPPPPPPPADVVEAPPPPVEAAPPSPSLLVPVLGGVGVVAVAAGTVAMVVGALPAIDHGEAVAAIQQAELEKADATALQERQQAARAAYESWGQVSLIAGAALAGVGLAAVVGAVGLVVAEQGTTE